MSRERWHDNFSPRYVGICDGKLLVMQNPKNSACVFFNVKGTLSIVSIGFTDTNYNLVYSNIGCQNRISVGFIRETSFFKKLAKDKL